MPLDLTDDKSTLVQVMAWCRQVSSHYMSQCWPRFMSPYGVTRPQWVKQNDISFSLWLIKLDSLQVLYIAVMRCSLYNRLSMYHGTTQHDIDFELWDISLEYFEEINREIIGGSLHLATIKILKALGWSLVAFFLTKLAKGFGKALAKFNEFSKLSRFDC